MLPNTEARERPSHRTNRVGCADADLHRVRCGGVGFERRGGEFRQVYSSRYNFVLVRVWYSNVMEVAPFVNVGITFPVWLPDFHHQHRT